MARSCIKGLRTEKFAAVAALSLYGCAVSLTHDLAFQAPPHWIASPTFRNEQLWIDPSNAYQTILIQRPATPLHSTPLVMRYAKSGPIYISGDDFVRKREDITICHSQPATFYSLRMHIGKEPSDVDVVQTKSRGQLVAAWYARPQGVTPQPPAENAIRSICAAKP
jgi:hypothetical protein